MLSIKEQCGNVYLMPLVEVDSCSFPKPRTAAKLWAFSPSDASVESVGFVPHLGTTLANLYTTTKKKAPTMPTTGEEKLRDGQSSWELLYLAGIGRKLQVHTLQLATTELGACTATSMEGTQSQAEKTAHFLTDGIRCISRSTTIFF